MPEVKARIEEVRLACRPAHEPRRRHEPDGPEDEPALARRPHGGAVSTRTLIPHRVHDAIGVLGAVSVATACLVPGRWRADARGAVPAGDTGVDVVVEHPTGFFTVTLDVDRSGEPPVVRRAGLLRTARLLMRGHVMMPARAWYGGVRR